MADAIVNFKQSTEYKCDKLGYLSAPVGKVRIHCNDVYVTSTVFKSPQLHFFWVSDTFKGCLKFESECS